MCGLLQDLTGVQTETYKPCIYCDECTQDGSSTKSWSQLCHSTNWLFSSNTEGGTCEPVSSCQTLVRDGSPKYSDTSRFNARMDGVFPAQKDLTAVCVFTHDARLPGLNNEVFTAYPTKVFHPRVAPLVLSCRAMT